MYHVRGLLMAFWLAGLSLILGIHVHAAELQPDMVSALGFALLVWLASLRHTLQVLRFWPSCSDMIAPHQVDKLL